MERNVPKFMSIKEVAHTGVLTEYTLRLMEKQGKLPCIYTGKKCLINFDRLLAQLDALTAEEASI